MSFKNKLQYCTRCLMPETQEGVNFDELGICTACQSSEDKMHIDWSKREKIFPGKSSKSFRKVKQYACCGAMNEE